MAALLLLAVVVGFLATLLRQPLIIAYIVVGLVAGPAVLGLATAQEEIGLLAELGIALLLFIVGLKLDIHLIRNTGPVALIAASAQMALTGLGGFLLTYAFGFDFASALYVAIAIAFSSTIIVVKLLSDRREIDELHGRIAVGFLIVQDLAVVIVMIALTAFGSANEGTSPATEFALVLAKGFGLVLVLTVLSRYVLGGLLKRLAHSQELIVLFSIAWAVGLAAVSDELGFGKEVGAFLGGVALASTDYRNAISARLVTLRDFLLFFFFLDLGIGLEIDGFGDQLVLAVALSVFVLVAKPVIVMVVMGLMGYRKRVSFLSGTAISQISEFSLVIAALGLSLKQIDEDVVTLLAAVALITFTTSTYLIIGGQRAFDVLSPRLSIFERDMKDVSESESDEPELAAPEFIVLGLGRYGGEMAKELVDAGYEVVGVDFDPVALSNWENAGNRGLYGDVEDPELPSLLDLGNARWVISSVPRRDVNTVLVQSLRRVGYEGKIAITVHRDEDAKYLERLDADLVLRPFVDAANSMAERLG